MNVPRRQPSRLRQCAIASVATGAALVASSAGAYVVVTSDNRVYDVQSRPEVRGAMVLFTLDGHPVSLRVWDVNVSKTNEMNHMMEGGTSPASFQQAVRSLQPATPVDDRLIVSSPLHRYMQEGPVSPDGNGGDVPPALSFSPDRPGRREPESARAGMTSFGDQQSPRWQAEPEREQSSSPFAAEARRALREAKQQQSEQPVESSAASDRRAGLESQLQAEQAHLRQLTSGEVPADDLDREIQRSTKKIRDLQNRISKLGGGATAAAPPAAEAPVAAAPVASGNYPEGSREAKWAQEIADAEARVSRLRQQQSALGENDADERESLEESINETQYKIDKLRKKLGGGS